MSKSSCLRKMNPISSSPACNQDWRRNPIHLPSRMMQMLPLANWKSKKLSHLLSKRKLMSNPLLRSPKPKPMWFHLLKMTKRSQWSHKLRSQKPKIALHLLKNPKLSPSRMLLCKMVTFMLKSKILNKFILKNKLKLHKS